MEEEETQQEKGESETGTRSWDQEE